MKVPQIPRICIAGALFVIIGIQSCARIHLECMVDFEYHNNAAAMMVPMISVIQG